MAGKHILVMIYFTSLLLALMISSSFSAEYQTLILPTSLPTPQTVEEALLSYSWDDTKKQSESGSNTTGFSVPLHHVDSLMSLQGRTSESLFNDRLERDARRANMIFSITKSSSAANNGEFSIPVISGIKWGSGEYFASIGVGSPRTDFYMIMDTGSDLTWLQCKPCKKCYEQVGPIFNPNNSKSFYRVPCVSEICGGEDTTGYCLNHTTCPYNITYGDDSSSSGDIVTETLTFGNKELPNVTLGCGDYNEGSFVAAGLLGLGRDGNLSFPIQAGRKFGKNNGLSFSYCLAYPGPSSLKFGQAYENASYTPLLTNPNPDFPMFYYVGLEGISVDGSRVRGINASTFEIDSKTGDGGVIVDSGTSVTRLTNQTYSTLRDAFQNATSKMLKNKLKKKDHSIFDTCYDLSGITTNVSVPTMDLHFRGADVSLQAFNYMITVDNFGTVCFGFAGTEPDGGLSIIGNFLQQSIGVVFDFTKNQIGFAENACT